MSLDENPNINIIPKIVQYPSIWEDSGHKCNILFYHVHWQVN